MLNSSGRIVLGIVVLAMVALPATAADILYDFEQATTAQIPDVLTSDGAQDGQTMQSSGNGAGFGPILASVGRNGSVGADFSNPTSSFFISNMVETQSVVDFVNAMSYSVDINLPALPAADTPVLWTGRARGVAETEFTITSSGVMKFRMAGLNPGGSFSSSAPLVTTGEYQSVGLTLGGGGDSQGHTLTFYRNGIPTDVFTGVGIAQPTLPMNGNAQGISPTQFGWFQTIGGITSDNQYQGFMDNMFISTRHVSAEEMAQRQIPEPTTLALAAAAGLGVLVRRRR